MLRGPNSVSPKNRVDLPWLLLRLPTVLAAAGAGSCNLEETPPPQDTGTDKSLIQSVAAYGLVVDQPLVLPRQPVFGSLAFVIRRRGLIHNDAGLITLTNGTCIQFAPPIESAVKPSRCVFQYLI